MPEELSTSPTDTTPTEPIEAPEGTEWISTLESDELKTAKSLEKFKSVDALAKSYLEVEKKASQGFKVPEKEDDEAWGDVYTKLGRPEKPDEYSLEGISNEAMIADEANKATIDRFKEVAHKYGLNNRQTAGIVDDILSLTLERQQAAGEATERNIQELRQDFGNAFDERVSLANDTLRKINEKAGGNWDRLSEALVQSGMSSQPDLVKALSSLGRMMEQDKIWGAGGEPRSMGGMTPGEIKAKISEIQSANLDDMLAGTPKGVQAEAEIEKLIDQLSAAVT